MPVMNAIPGTDEGKPESPDPRPAVFRTVTPETAIRMMAKDDRFVLLDVRTAREYDAGRIRGAGLIPHTELAVRAPAELPDKDLTVFVYCHAGVRSLEAGSILHGLGYARVFDVGGIVDWPEDAIEN